MDEADILSLRVPVAERGLMDGLDPSLPDFEYPPQFSPDMENIRIASSRWSTRLGMSLDASPPGSGDVRWLTNQYEVSGKRVRLFARGTGAGAALYDFVVGTDTAYNTTTGGSSLGGTAQPYFQGVCLRDRVYFTDRAGALRKYQETPASGNQVQAVAQPAVPGAAPTVLARPYGYLDSWTGNAGVAPFGWTVSNSGRYNITDASSTFPAPGGGRSVQLQIINASAINETITRNVASQPLNSHTVAYWVNQTRNRFHQEFRFGSNSATDFNNHDRCKKKAEWEPFFIPVGDVPTINFKQFKCINATVSSDYVSPLYLPGRLDGSYRWVYTHYDPSAGRESKPSAQSNSGVPLDFTAQGINADSTTSRAFSKACALTFTSDSGTDSSTTKIRVYRNGGVPSLTKDDAGRDVWYRVGEVYDQSTTLATSPVVGATSFDVASVTNLAAGDTLVLDKGVATGTADREEFVTIATGGITGSTITLTEPLVYAHTSGHAVQVAFIDNTANEMIDTSTRIDLERDTPPAAIQWLALSPDGRLWAFNYTSHPTGIAVSNRATPERPQDYEVFPDSVDPLTRHDLLQGWRFDIGGDTTDEAIVWGGFYRGVATVLTRKNLYVINAASQSDWGPLAVQKILNTGCIAGDTVQEVNGALYWVADGPRVMRWGGEGPPEIISHNLINTRLNAAPSTYWVNWFARYHARRDGHYYCLYYTPSGQTTNVERLEYNVDEQAWEPVRHYMSGGSLWAWAQAAVRDGGSDDRSLYQVSTSGLIFQAETGSTDNNVAIKTRFLTKRFQLGVLGLVTEVFIRLAAATDTLTLQVRTGGSEYAQTSHTYSLSTSGTNDLEIRQKVDRDLLGRWVDIQLSGDVSNRPEVREITVRYVNFREGRASG